MYQSSSKDENWKKQIRKFPEEFKGRIREALVGITPRRDPRFAGQGNSGGDAHGADGH